MKANELMLGDWVIFRDTPYTIATIAAQDMVIIEAEAEKSKFCKAESLKPIPVTSEILSANDWDSQWKDDGEVYFFNGNNIGDAVDFDVRRANESNKGDLSLFDGDILIPMWNAGIEVRYVHEIQHLLRIVSNNPFAIRLADNFKIK